MSNIPDQRFAFTSYCITGLILSSIKRNGLEVTLEDLRKNCRAFLASDELTYRDFLNVVNSISVRCENVDKMFKQK